MEINNNLMEECKELLLSIIKQQRTLCRICIKLYGEGAPITQDAQARLNKYVSAFHTYYN